MRKMQISNNYQVGYIASSKSWTVLQVGMSGSICTILKWSISVWQLGHVHAIQVQIELTITL